MDKHLGQFENKMEAKLMKSAFVALKRNTQKQRLINNGEANELADYFRFSSMGRK